MPDLVVDASLAAKWVIEESYSGEARTLLRQWAQAGTTATYNALYLATAELLDCELWTADDRLYHAAVQAGLGWVRHVREARTP